MALNRFEVEGYTLLGTVITDSLIAVILTYSGTNPVITFAIVSTVLVVGVIAIALYNSYLNRKEIENLKRDFKEYLNIDKLKERIIILEQHEKRE